jgi:DNA-directed RNA polymerase subunit RPC12/RpoP
MHVYLAAACPQCRSTTMVVTNQDDAWGKDHAINCGVCGRRVIAAGLPAVWPRGESRTDDPRPGAGAVMRRLS